MSTIWADSDGVHDDFAAPADLDEWLNAVGVELAGETAKPTDLDQALRLRDATRRLAAHVTADTRLAAASRMERIDYAITTLNDAVRFTPHPRLDWCDDTLSIAADTPGARVRSGLAVVALATMQLLGGSDAATVRACNAPGCVLYFVRTHPRREWCSVACGNRVRAARHYERVRADRAR